MKYFVLAITLFITVNVYSQNKRGFDIVRHIYIHKEIESFYSFTQISKGIQILNTYQYQRALSIFNKELKKDTLNPDLWYLSGYCLLELGLYNESIRYCNKSLELLPENLQAYNIKAYSLLLSGDTIQAIEIFGNMKKEHPGKLEGYHGLAVINFLNKNYSESLSEIEAFYLYGDNTNSAYETKKTRKLRKDIQKILKK